MEDVFFKILIPREGYSFQEQMDCLMLQYDALLHYEGRSTVALLQARFYLSDAANQAAELRNHTLVTKLLPNGVVSVIEQPPLCGVKVALLLWFVGGEVVSKQVENLPDGTLISLKTSQLTYYMQTVRMGDEAARWDAARQTEEAFKSHIRELGKRGLNLKDHCQRTWIYVRDVDRQYADVVKARNEVFEREGLTTATHYITSTGIGGASENSHALVAMDFFSVEGLREGDVSYLTAPDYLNPTYEYGVAFERGTLLRLPQEKLLLISGTASIDSHGQCLYEGDVLAQTERLFLNIQKLLESGGVEGKPLKESLRYIIVYLRDVADYGCVRAYLRLHLPGVPCLITQARVCRPEWLIEVETIAS